jgi:hypothetical protein
LKKFIAGLCAALTALQPFAAIAQQYPSVMRDIAPIEALLPVPLFGKILPIPTLPKTLSELQVTRGRLAFQAELEDHSGFVSEEVLDAARPVCGVESVELKKDSHEINLAVDCGVKPNASATYRWTIDGVPEPIYTSVPYIQIPIGFAIKKPLIRLVAKVGVLESTELLFDFSNVPDHIATLFDVAKATAPTITLSALCVAPCVANATVITQTTIYVLMHQAA